MGFDWDILMVLVPHEVAAVNDRRRIVQADPSGEYLGYGCRGNQPCAMCCSHFLLPRKTQHITIWVAQNVATVDTGFKRNSLSSQLVQLQ